MPTGTIRLRPMGDERRNIDPGKESRAASGIPVIPALDGFRAIAIIAIVLYHVSGFSGLADRFAGAPGGEISAILAIGVDVLFVISGFVVFLPSVVRGGEMGSIKAYALRRGARLLPAYWLVLGVVALIFALLTIHEPPYAGSGPTMLVPGPADYLAHALMAQTPLALLDPSFRFGLGIEGPVWTLSNEILFYITLPFIAGAFYRHPLRGLLIGAAITLAWHFLFVNFDSVAPLLGIEKGSAEAARVVLVSYYQLPNWAFSFAAGMAAACAFVWLQARPERGRIERSASWSQPLFLATFLLAAHLSYKHGMERRLPLESTMLTLSIAGILLSTSLASAPQQAPFANRPVRWLADISYGIYLIHYPLLATIVAVASLPTGGSVGDFMLWSAIVLAGTVVYGFLSARFVERPIRRWALRYGRSVEGAGISA